MSRVTRQRTVFHHFDLIINIWFQHLSPEHDILLKTHELWGWQWIRRRWPPATPNAFFKPLILGWPSPPLQSTSHFRCCKKEKRIFPPEYYTSAYGASHCWCDIEWHNTYPRKQLNFIESIIIIIIIIVETSISANGWPSITFTSVSLPPTHPRRRRCSIDVLIGPNKLIENTLLQVMRGWPPPTTRAVRMMSDDPREETKTLVSAGFEPSPPIRG